jgi:hypothetical protein
MLGSMGMTMTEAPMTSLGLPPMPQPSLHDIPTSTYAQPPPPQVSHRAHHIIPPPPPVIPT